MTGGGGAFCNSKKVLLFSQKKLTICEKNTTYVSTVKS